jgi:hypothetical protein
MHCTIISIRTWFFGFFNLILVMPVIDLSDIKLATVCPVPIAFFATFG